MSSVRRQLELMQQKMDEMAASLRAEMGDQLCEVSDAKQEAMARAEAAAAAHIGET